MPATNDTPLKRFTAFWVVLGAFLLFGIIALVIAPLVKTPEVTAADEAGSKRRLAIRELVEAEQVKNLSRVENGDKLQVSPAEVFSLVGSKLVSTKPAAMKDEKFRDPAVAAAEKPVEEAPSNKDATPAAPKQVAPAAESSPAPTPPTPAMESISESAEPSAN